MSSPAPSGMAADAAPHTASAKRVPGGAGRNAAYVKRTLTSLLTPGSSMVTP